MRRDVHDELRARLHEAAEEHRPDRARMLARIERGMAEEDQGAGHRAVLPPVFGWLRVAGASAAVAAVLGIGGYAVASAVREEPPPQGTVAASPTPTPSPDATSRPPADPSPEATPENSGSAEGREDGAPASTAPESPPASSAAGDTGSAQNPGQVEDGPLWSDGSVDPHSNEFWAQSNVTLRSTERLTALTVELRIAQTGGVTSTGAWRSLPESDFDLTVAERDGFLVYTWVLKDGRTVPAGEFVFAGQYDHDRGGRDAGDDDYSATADTDGGAELSVSGDFAPRKKTS
ncbi:hypothetical protein [Streptomyces sp. B93]|uniref:hypothetical protein n=1 Tax=Streptomyces sp. B93 TaxID=2824875 RepID=UPI001B386689|nr:hypothetical protein [Streptomyces sp. B93]MBQ1087577.1 hypothetical protein [Streptomyces sp. B93]